MVKILSPAASQCLSGLAGEVLVLLVHAVQKLNGAT